jgi:allantoinase
MPDLVVVADRALIGGGFRPAVLQVTGGRIATVQPPGSPLPDGAAVLRLAEDEVLLPGLVDTHVHVNEPGRTHWEGFATATRAAAAGGVTTILDMPLNAIPPTLDPDALAVKRRAATGEVFTDVGFLGGVVPGDPGRLAALAAAGVYGFKCFLLPSGVPEFPPVGDAGLPAAMTEIARLDSLLMVHAEDADTVAEAPPASGGRYSDYLASRPAEAEAVAVGQVARAAARTGARAHIVHLSSAAGVAVLRAAQRAGVRLTAETCPHYLALDPANIPDGATEFKCCPPIRGGADADALWQALADGVITAVVSDHSPCPPAMKALATGDFAAAWGGVSSIQLGLPVMWTAAQRRGVPLQDVVRWMSAGPADLVRMAGKGRIQAGADADLVVFAPDQRHRVLAGELRQRHYLTPYNGTELTGVVRSVLLAGRPVTDTPAGRLLSREDR